MSECIMRSPNLLCMYLSLDSQLTIYSSTMCSTHVCFGLVWSKSDFNSQSARIMRSIDNVWINWLIHFLLNISQNILTNSWNHRLAVVYCSAKRFFLCLWSVLTFKTVYSSTTELNIQTNRVYNFIRSIFTEFSSLSCNTWICLFICSN